MELGVGYPGYHTLMPKSNGTITQILKGQFDQGWNKGKRGNLGLLKVRQPTATKGAAVPRLSP